MWFSWFIFYEGNANISSPPVFSGNITHKHRSDKTGSITMSLPLGSSTVRWWRARDLYEINWMPGIVFQPPFRRLSSSFYLILSVSFALLLSLVLRLFVPRHCSCSCSWTPHLTPKFSFISARTLISFFTFSFILFGKLVWLKLKIFL